ncbi:PIN-like domain-containing protein [Lactococcus lactis subsp. lactis]|uniref:PIN-like domain-containing protein n=1 Tax=Lactococcus lactis TaxID=1358 RepID=UPI002A7ED650|nr:PIN-like domain-containing protein [Lactococcus lactis]MDY4364185.1 PIN-like domain-containing protein [Lactococcus lactis subsp. lactis]
MSKMQNEFPEFYQVKLKKEDIKNSLIVFDTNYLLDILRLPVGEANKYLKALRHVKNNMYIPYHVALEFNFNKITVKTETRVALDLYKQNVMKQFQVLEDEINGLSLLKSDSMKKTFTDSMLEVTSDFKEKLSEELTSQISKSFSDKNIYKQLIKNIENSIGEKYTQDWINTVEEKGEERYEKNIPPGFDDAVKNEVIRTYGGLEYHEKYGDLIIWKDIIEKAKTIEETKIIFVTNDGKSNSKNDLLFKVKGQTIGPSIYLINELKKESKKDLYILNNIRFAELTDTLSEEEIIDLRNSEVHNSLDNKQIRFRNNFSDDIIINLNLENERNNINREYEKEFYLKRLSEISKRRKRAEHRFSYFKSKIIDAENPTVQEKENFNYLNDRLNHLIFEEEKIIDKIVSLENFDDKNNLGLENQDFDLY